ncbi:hypothetical protein PG993_001472 [Apiospora rasikravindrae]|uniref:Uncharacterized protein n=1 Tax=Apiospora rasikravindrae TaxID=990691 RepID=A0ABR1UBH5_9PEZI
MSAQATAATLPAGTSPKSQIPSDHANRFIASGKAVIEWGVPGAPSQCLAHPDPRNRHITFEASLEKDGPQCFSFFRLRVPVMHMHLHAIVLYIHIPPNHISSLEWTLGDTTVNPAAQSKLGGNLTRLQFHLKEPAQVIVPDQVPLKPKKPATATIVKALESLTTALDLTIYLEHTTLSKVRLGSITEAIQSGLSRPVARYGDLHRLYKGMGGSILSDFANPDSADSDVPAPAQADSPPSYDEIGPGPPMPPVAHGHAKAPDSSKRPYKRRRQCSASSTQTDNDDTALPTHMPGRLLKNQVPGPAKGEARATFVGLADGEVLPSWAHNLFAELAELKGVVSMQERVIQDLRYKLEKLEGQARTHGNEHAVLQRRMDEADVAIVDLDATAAQQGECLSELEDGLASLQEDWESLPGRHAPELELVKEELRAEVLSRLRNALESP